MATLQTVLNFARAQALTDSNGLTDTNGIIFANEALQDIARRFIASGIDGIGIQEAYTDATANVGTYLYPTDMFFLKAIEVNYQDTTPGNYIVANQVDQSNISAGRSFSWLRANQSARFPLFADNGDWFEIFPTPTAANNLSQLMRIYYFLEPTEFSSTSDSINYPFSLDYRMLGWRIASSYLKSLSSWDSVPQFDLEYENRMKDLIKTLGRGVQQPMQAVPIQDTGWFF